VAGVAAEQRLEHAQLADAGVLVLVEQHDLPAGPLAAAHLGRGDGDPRGVGHLVGVVDGAGARLRASNASTSGSSATRARCRASISCTGAYGPRLRGASG
jgi:hypothetical protein